MGDVRLTFDDGSVVRLELASTPGDSVEPGAGGHAVGEADSAGGDGELALPEGFGAARPVSVDGRAARALTRGGEALADALRPLGGVLGGIHRSFAESEHRPDEVTVEFGVSLGSDLSLGVFSGKGEASFTVSATWNLADTTAGPRGTGSSGTDGDADAQGTPQPTQSPTHVPGQVNGS